MYLNLSDGRLPGTLTPFLAELERCVTRLCPESHTTLRAHEEPDPLGAYEAGTLQVLRSQGCPFTLELRLQDSHYLQQLEVTLTGATAEQASAVHQALERILTSFGVALPASDGGAGKRG